MGLLRRTRLPSEALSSLRQHLDAEGIDSPPRVLAWAPTADGVAVGLEDRLGLLRGGAWTTLPWETILSASWDDAGTQFMWSTTARPHATASVSILDPGRLPEVVRERVEQTFVARSTVALAPGVSATLIGRRPARGDGPITWSIVPPRGVNMARPDLAAEAAVIVERARLEWC